VAVTLGFDSVGFDLQLLALLFERAHGCDIQHKPATGEVLGNAGQIGAKLFGINHDSTLQNHTN
jgi:hypothetical protein